MTKTNDPPESLNGVGAGAGGAKTRVDEGEGVVNDRVDEDIGPESMKGGKEMESWICDSFVLMRSPISITERGTIKDYRTQGETEFEIGREMQ